MPTAALDMTPVRYSGWHQKGQARPDPIIRLFAFYLQIATKREPTSGLEPLTCSLRVIIRRCRGLHEVANPAYSKRFPFSGLLSVAPYCVPGGIRVVSGGRRLRVAGTYSL